MMGFSGLSPSFKFPEKNRLTRVTRIFQKSVFTEATPAARTGNRAGLFAARTQDAAAQRRIFTRKQKGISHAV
jgi:hypothetical protein